MTPAPPDSRCWPPPSTCPPRSGPNSTTLPRRSRRHQTHKSSDYPQLLKNIEALIDDGGNITLGALPPFDCGFS